MSLSPLEKLNNSAISQTNQPPQDALRRTAQQFEALFLMQLTSALNGSNEEGEDSLFGSDGGSDLAKKMFSEQMATTLAEAGGIGLADVIMKSFGVSETKSADNKMNPLQKTISAVKEIQNSAVRETSSNDSVSPNTISESANSAPQIFTPSAEVLLNKRERIIADKPITSSGNEAVASVSFQLPANGRISSTFGSRFHPIDKKVKFHGGMDVAIPTGTRVNSAADGVVEFAGKRGGYGNLVIVRHADGRETRYAHLHKILVAAGDPVSGGQEIAKSGSTGKSTGPHLHFEVRENGQVVNPLKILSNVLAQNNR